MALSDRYFGQVNSILNDSENRVQTSLQAAADRRLKEEQARRTQWETDQQNATNAFQTKATQDLATTQNNFNTQLQTQKAGFDKQLLGQQTQYETDLGTLQKQVATQGKRASAEFKSAMKRQNQIYSSVIQNQIKQQQQAAQAQIGDGSSTYTSGVSSTPTSVKIPASQDPTGIRSRIIAAAKTDLGVPYQWGGNSLSKGVDCSGLVQQAYKSVGISVPRKSNAQASMGRRVDISQLKPGDLVAWDNSTRNVGADHIAIYLGSGKIIEAPHTGAVTRIRTLTRNEGAWGVSITLESARDPNVIHNKSGK